MSERRVYAQGWLGVAVTWGRCWRMCAAAAVAAAVLIADLRVERGGVVPALRPQRMGGRMELGEALPQPLSEAAGCRLQQLWLRAPLHTRHGVCGRRLAWHHSGGQRSGEQAPQARSLSQADETSLHLADRQADSRRLPRLHVAAALVWLG